MIRLSVRRVMRSRGRGLVRYQSLILIGGSFVLLLAASYTGQLATAAALSEYWRPTYDILVRPPGSLTYFEGDQYRLVAPNYLSGLSGGITLKQYEAIKSIPGVEVAAPVAMVGYFPRTILKACPSVSATSAQVEESYALYKEVRVVTAGDGVHQYSGNQVWWSVNTNDWVEMSTEGGYYLVDSDGRRYDISEFYSWAEDQAEIFQISPRLSPDWPAGPERLEIIPQVSFGVYLLLAGIDPQQEDALVGLGDAVREGRYLSPDDRVETRRSTIRLVSFSGEEGAMYVSIEVVPVLISNQEYRDFSIHISTYTLRPSEGDNIPQKLSQEGKDYLRSLPAELVSECVVDSEALRAGYLNSLKAQLELFEQGEAEAWRATDVGAYFHPSPVQYAEIPVPQFASGYDLALEAEPQGTSRESPVQGVRMEKSMATFRQLQSDTYADGRNYNFLPVGLFSLENLAQDPLIAVPMETYTPPLVTLVFDEEGNPTEPLTVRPTHNPAGYITPPPLMLTTLEGAAFFSPDEDFISAIRVRVEGVERIGEAAQQRIEAVAEEIEERTGLETDIILGSSPQPVLVHLPGLGDAPATGWVQENWIKQLVAITIYREANQMDLVIFGVVLVAATLYVFNSSALSVLGWTKELGILAALGWRPGTILRLILAEAVFLGVGAGLLGLLISWAIVSWLDLLVPFSRLAVIIPLAIGLYLAGYLVPAWRASRVPPIPLLQRGEISPTAPRVGRLSVWSYAVRSALRRRARSSVSVLLLALASAVLTSLVSISVLFQGILEGTLLGRYVWLQVGGYHYAGGVVCFLLAAFTVGEVMLVNVRERHPEIGVLKALGWRDGDLLKVFLLEAGFLGLVGGILGGMLAATLVWAFFGQLTVFSLIIPGLVVSIFTSVVAAWYPARRAAMILPAEAVRRE